MIAPDGRDAPVLNGMPLLPPNAGSSLLTLRPLRLTQPFAPALTVMLTPAPDLAHAASRSPSLMMLFLFVMWASERQSLGWRGMPIGRWRQPGARARVPSGLHCSIARKAMFGLFAVSAR